MNNGSWFFIPALALALVAVFLLEGCGSITKQADQIMVRLTVQQATLRVIADDADRAARVEQLAGQALDYASGEAVVLDEVYHAVWREIRWDSLSLADRALIEALMLQLHRGLTERYGDGVLSPDDLISVRTVLLWIQQDAEFAARVL